MASPNDRDPSGLDSLPNVDSMAATILAEMMDIEYLTALAIVESRTGQDKSAA